MGLSGREVLLILRARDEASRTIGRVSSAMSRMDRDAMMSARRQLDATQTNLLGMRRHVHDIEDAYRNQAYAARSAWLQGKITSKQYQQAMLDAAVLRQNQMHDLRIIRQDTEDYLRQQQDSIRRIHEEKDALRARGHQMIANGQAAIGMGAAMTYFGAMGTAAYASNIQASMDYETQVARTMTQIDTFNAKQKEISRLGKQVADEIPVAFEEIQPALYDIFSSIDVGLGGARTLIKQFSKDAVGGMASLETATRANLQIMNAWKVEAKDATQVSDFMFQLVRKGVGTYDEFAKSIGRAIPSAARAGQQYQTLGAMMAFMTRNGLSTAMAATSSARALDAISNAKTVDKMEKLGIAVKDVHGEFKPLPDILDQMSQKMKGMSGPERASWLQELLTGSGGTIQARRFFDMYFKNADEFKKRNKEMQNSAGAAREAFERMAESPQAKIQQLKNDWMLLRIEIGENLLPGAIKVIETVNGWIDAFKRLDPHTKKIIIWAVGIGTVLLTVAGVFTMVAGVIMVVAGAAGALGLSIGALVGYAALGIAALGGIAGAGKLVKDNWDKIGPKLAEAKDKLEEFKSYVSERYGPAVSDAFNDVKDGASKALDDIKIAWNNFKDDIDWEGIKSDFKGAKGDIKESSDAIVGAIRFMGQWTNATFQMMGIVIRVFGAAFGPILNGAIRTIIMFVQGAIKFIDGMITFVTGAVRAMHGLFTADWGEMWNGAKQMTRGAVKMIIGFFEMLVRAPLRLLKGLVKGVIGLFQEMYDVLVGHSIVPDMVNEIVHLFKSLPGKVLSAIASMPGQVINKFQDLYNKTTKKVGDMVDKLVSMMRALPDKMKNAVGNVGGILRSKGQSLVQGFINGIESMIGLAANAVGRLRNLWDSAKSVAGSIGGAVGSGLGALGDAITPRMIAGQKPKKLSWIDKLKNQLKDVKVTKGIKKTYKDVYVELIKDMGEEMPKMSGVFDVARGMISKKLDAMAKKLKGDAKKAFAKSRDKRTKGMLHDVAEATEKDMKRLQRVTKMYQATMKKLEKAREDLQKMRQDRLDLINTVKDDLTGFGGLGGLTKPQDVFGNEEDWTVGNITSQLQGKLATIKKFGQNLDWILKHYGKETYRQVLAMGITDGAAFAEALVTATPSEAAGIESLLGQINTASNSIATAAGNNMYNAGIAAAEGLVKGLESKAKELREIAKRLGVLIAQEIKKALKIKSPSRVGKDIASNFVGSIASQMWGERKQLSRASSILAQAMQFESDATYSSNTYRRPPVVGGRGGSGFAGTGGPTELKQEINIHTQEIDPRQHASELGWELAARYRF